MSRIQLTDSTVDIVMKMAEGNPGAISAIMAIMNDAADIDPQAFMGGLGVILSLDTMEIYGTDIYILFNDKCNRDVRQMVMLLRASQLGMINTSKIQGMAADQDRQIDLTTEEWADLDSKVCGQLDEFARPEAKEEVA